MRRSIGMMVVGGLIAALCHQPVLAATVPSLAYVPDIQTALFERLFGESTDAQASLAASYGDRASESFLRTRALRATLPAAPAIAQAQRAIAFDGPSPASLEFDADAAVDNVTIAPIARFEPKTMPQPLLATYRTAPAPVVTAQPLSFSFGNQAPIEPPLVTFSPIVTTGAGFDASSAQAPQLETSTQSGAEVPVPVRVGKVHIQTDFESTQTQTTQLSLNDQASTLGANFNVRAGTRSLKFGVAGGLEHVTAGDGMPVESANFDGTSNFQLPLAGGPMVAPSFSDVLQHTVATGVAMPITHNLTFGMQYDVQRLQGDYGAAGLSSLDAQANSYGANLTLALPHLSSAIVFSAKQYRYQDNLLPTNAFNQTRANLNYTVKF